jgi:hypothetical protein
MAIAPQNIMAKLSDMEDQELANYARINERDPYIFPLAFQESQRRKRMRAAQQAQAAGMQPPKVVDQRLQEMDQAAAPAMGAAQLPEDVGIAQLPAPNMETINKASGGIIAFGDGGEVPRFQVGGVPQVLPGGLGIYNQGAFSPQVGSTENLSWSQRKMDEIATKVAEGTATPQEKAWLSMFGGAAKERVNARQQQALYQTAPNQMGAETQRLQTVNAAANTATTAKAEADKAAADKAAADVVARPQPTPAAGLPSLAPYEKKISDMAKANEAKLREATDRNAQTKADYLEEFISADKPYFKAAREAIDKETSRLKSDKEQDFYMALIQGGLAAAGESGPNALQNIAKGFATGAGSYKDALKDFRKATQENTKAELELQRYQATGKKDALKSFNDHQARRDDRFAAGVAQIYSQQMQTTGQLTAQEMQTRGQMAIASMPGQNERLYTSLADPTSAAYKGFKNYAQLIGPEAKGDTALRTAAINKWSSEPMLRQEFNNDFDSYFRMMSGQQATLGATAKQLEYLKMYAPK